MNIEVNQAIRVINEDNDYNACVDSVLENEIAITLFDFREEIEPGNNIIIEVPGSNAAYLGQSMVLKVLFGNKNCSLVISKPQSFNRVQRRESTRVKMTNNIDYGGENLEKVYQGKILDISGKGLRLSSAIELRIDSILNLIFHLKNNSIDQKLAVKAKVVRHFKSISGFQYGLLFIDLEASEKEIIAKFVMSESVKKRALSSFLAHP